MTGASSIRVVNDAPNLREMTTETLRNAILDMHFKPNDRLVERALCEQTGVSRTCVREALQHLVSEGLVVRVPNKGLYVASVGIDEARQIYEVRAALEPAAGRMFAKRATEKDLKLLETAYDKLLRASKKTSIAAYVDAFDKFYDILLSGADNEVARGIINTLRARMNYLRTMTSIASDRAHKAESVARVREIVDAALRRDAEKTAKFCESFVRRSAEFADQVLREQESD